VPATALFVYGTLTDGRRLHAVTGRSFRRRPAHLDGYERVEPPGSYPYVVPKPDGRVEGWLIEDVDADSLLRLDAYEDEGRLYWRRPVAVIADGVPVACEVYVGNVDLLSSVRRRQLD
jgi:gamma-glutamylcyclotransferase (GGCT)/AIG2-like uncharacterized protein YtfP